jgi:hypothetical protein
MKRFKHTALTRSLNAVSAGLFAILVANTKRAASTTFPAFLIMVGYGMSAATPPNVFTRACEKSRSGLNLIARAPIVFMSLTASDNASALG